MSAKVSNPEYILGLSLVPGLGSVRIRLLLKHLKSAKEIWHMPEMEFRALKLPADVKDSFLNLRKKIDPARELEKVARGGSQVLTIDDPNYPKLLKEIYDPPVVLYVKGNLNSVNSKIAVVGTRLMTTYGHLVTESLTRDLASAGLTIVSGLARGVDSLAHRTTLQVGGETVAVLGSGLNRIYPSENKFLAEEISRRGAVISEYPLETEPSPGTFPSRNRIIAGLSLGVLVTEAGEDSGSLITANCALEEGRAVFCVPGSILSKQSLGTNNLIKIGAKPVTGSADILEDLKIEQAATYEMVEIKGANKTESNILQHLSLQPIHIDDLSRETKLPVSDLGSALTVMILAGKVTELGGSFYARKH